MGDTSIQEDISDAMSAQDWIQTAVDITILLGFVGFLYIGFKKWVRKTATPAETAAKRLETSNGHTVGYYVEDMHQKLEHVLETSKENRVLIQLAHERLDRHLKEDHIDPSK